MEYAVIGLGSNKSFQGMNCTQILASAVAALSDVLEDMTVSSVYITKPMYYEDQENFHNMAVSGYFDGSAMELLDQLHKIENAHGRDRSKEIRNGPRSLDLDIELFGRQTIKTETLVVPHERLLERSFVLTPLTEVLNSNADVFIEDLEKYRNCLDSLDSQDIKLCLTSEEFLRQVQNSGSLRKTHGTGRSKR